MNGVKPYASKEEEEEHRIGGAERLMDAWAEKYGGEIVGHVSIQGQKIGRDINQTSDVVTARIGEQPKPSGMTKLPRGSSLQDASRVFAARDKLKAAAPEADPAAITQAAVKEAFQPPRRVPKYPWLAILYLAITKEQS